MADWQVSLEQARKALFDAEHAFAVLMKHGTMSVELYSPVGSDEQTAHAQDELYIVVAGTGMFNKAGVRRPFKPNDVIFVEAGVDHRFEGFSDDFQTWVVFWGPKGGEKG